MATSPRSMLRSLPGGELATFTSHWAPTAHSLLVPSGNAAKAFTVSQGSLRASPWTTGMAASGRTLRAMGRISSPASPTAHCGNGTSATATPSHQEAMRRSDWELSRIGSACNAITMTSSLSPPTALSGLDVLIKQGRNPCLPLPESRASSEAYRWV